MKFNKIILLFSFLILCSGFRFDNSINLSPLYKINDNLEVKFYPANYGTKAKNTYKKLLKNEKYIDNGKYEKAFAYLTDFVPNLVRETEFLSKSGKYREALKTALEAERLDGCNIIPKNALNLKIGILYSKVNDYVTSNTYILPLLGENSDTGKQAVYQAGENYYNLRDYKKSAECLSKVDEKSKYYISSLEMLTSSYIIMKDGKNAYFYAKKLVNTAPDNPEHFMMLGYVSQNSEEKLNCYNKALTMYLEAGADNAVSNADKRIAELEQQKIDEAYKKISIYCKKPDWQKIKERSANMLEGDVQYWHRRQTDFFNTAKDCISRYSGNNLSACFNDLNETQYRLDSELAAEAFRRHEAEQRELEINLMRQQNKLLYEQNLWNMYRYSRPRYYGGWPWLY